MKRPCRDDGGGEGAPAKLGVVAVIAFSKRRILNVDANKRSLFPSALGYFRVRGLSGSLRKVRPRQVLSLHFVGRPVCELLFRKARKS